MIERYCVPLTCGRIDLDDDAAVLDIPADRELVVTSDTLNEGTHFMAGEDPYYIGRKALRVNLSDLAAMGADPLCYQLNVAFPQKPDAVWLAAFSKGLQEDNARFDVFCSGGDTTSIKGGCLSVSVTALGTVPKGKAVRRGGAKAGDVLIVTGPVGDAFLGLKVLQDGLDKALYAGAVERYRVPEPRVGIAALVRDYAHAGADISDGLVADCLHIAKASGLGVDICTQDMVFSNDVRRALDAGIVTVEDVLAGGDDYELVLAVSPEKSDIFMGELKKNDLSPYVIGKFESDISDVFVNGTNCIDIKVLGWKHF